MLFCGRSFCGGQFSLGHTPTAVSNIKGITLRNGIYDDLYITRDITYPYTTVTPDIWDFDTVLHAAFNGTLHAGNVQYGLDEVACIRIKRREEGSFDWITLFEIPVTKNDDFRFQVYDRYARAKTKYEYAMVPVTNNTEGNLNINTVYSDFDGLFLTEKDRSFHCLIQVEVQLQKNHPGELVNTLEGRYPFVVSSSRNNYYSGTASGVFIDFDPGACDWETESGVKLRDQLLEFLENGRAKVLKLEDGRIWLIGVMDAATEQATDHPLAPVTTFSWTQTGDACSVADLYYNGLIDVNPEWWVTR